MIYEDFSAPFAGEEDAEGLEEKVDEEKEEEEEKDDDADETTGEEL